MATELTITTLPIVGYQGNPVPNTFLRQGSDTDHLAIVFPGFSYSPDLPVLYYPSLVMLTRGADVLRVRYAYDSDQTFLKMSSEERSGRFGADVEGVCAAALSQRSYKRITLIGKSLGTLALAYILNNNEQLRDASYIWLTPLLRDERLIAAIRNNPPRSLFIIGTSDEHYDQQLLDEVANATSGTRLVIEGANHGLEIRNDVGACIRAVEEIVQAVNDFL
jgi:hypothetical protein